MQYINPSLHMLEVFMPVAKDEDFFVRLLDEVKESIINAYEIKTGQSRTKLSHLMDSETWMNAWKAKELGFCDEVMFAEGDQPDTKNVSGFSYYQNH